MPELPVGSWYHDSSHDQHPPRPSRPPLQLDPACDQRFPRLTFPCNTSFLLVPCMNKCIRFFLIYRPLFGSRSQSLCEMRNLTLAETQSQHCGAVPNSMPTREARTNIDVTHQPKVSWIKRFI